MQRKIGLKISLGQRTREPDEQPGCRCLPPQPLQLYVTQSESLCTVTEAANLAGPSGMQTTLRTFRSADSRKKPTGVD